MKKIFAGAALLIGTLIAFGFSSVAWAATPMLAVGSEHSCALTSAGTVLCWGRNYYGELGNNSVNNSYTPDAVTGLSGPVVAIAAGQYHTCALTDAGAVQCWGLNGSGQLGNGTTAESHIPVTPEGLTSGVVAIATGANHSCALISDGGMQCWGANGNGQLGIGTTAASTKPLPVTGLSSGVIAIGVGYNHSCAVTSGGALQCWGYNVHGELGNGTTTQSTTPVGVAGLSSGVVAVTGGIYHTCALTSGGAVMCWGYNAQGELGNGTVTQSTAPVAVTGLSSGVVAIAVGQEHSCALTGAGAVRCWGLNTSGQLGNGTTTNASTSVAVTGFSSGVAAIGAGGDHSCAVTSDGAVKCWGGNTYGQLGNRTTTNSSLPVAVLGVGGIGLLNLGPVSHAGIDFNGDGLSDLLWHNATTGETYVWLMNGQSLVGGGYLPTVPDTNWQIAGIGDLDGDGKADVVWHNASSGQTYVWLVNGLALAGGGYLATIPTDWQIARVADLDGDGKADIVWRNTGTGETYSWLMNGLTIKSGAYLPTVADLDWQL